MSPRVYLNMFYTGNIRTKLVVYGSHVCSINAAIATNSWYEIEEKNEGDMLYKKRAEHKKE